MIKPAPCRSDTVRGKTGGGETGKPVRKPEDDLAVEDGPGQGGSTPSPVRERSWSAEAGGSTWAGAKLQKPQPEHSARSLRPACRQPETTRGQGYRLVQLWFSLTHPGV